RAVLGSALTVEGAVLVLEPLARSVLERLPPVINKLTAIIFAQRRAVFSALRPRVAELRAVFDAAAAIILQPARAIVAITPAPLLQLCRALVAPLEEPIVARRIVLKRLRRTIAQPCRAVVPLDLPVAARVETPVAAPIIESAIVIEAAVVAAIVVESSAVIETPAVVAPEVPVRRNAIIPAREVVEVRVAMHGVEAIQILHADVAADDVAIHANVAESVVYVNVAGAHERTAALDPPRTVPAVVVNAMPAPIPVAIEPRADRKSRTED